MEQLLQELNSEKVKSQKRISQLQNEISTLRGLLRHYIAQVDSLGKENAGLRMAENAEIRNENRSLSNRMQEVTRKKRDPQRTDDTGRKAQRHRRGSHPAQEKRQTGEKITKAKQLMVTFTIPQNNSTPVGQKTVYLRITSPEGALLGNA